MSAVGVSTQYHTEIIDGRQVLKPLPKKLHILVQTYLTGILLRDLARQYRVMPELNVLCGNERLVPDITVVKRNARYRNGDLDEPALFCVEILSPGQTVGNLLDKADRIVRAGTSLCWIIWPERRKAWAYSIDEFAECTEALRATLSQDDVVEIGLAPIWAELEGE